MTHEEFNQLKVGDTITYCEQKFPWREGVRFTVTEINRKGTNMFSITSSPVYTHNTSEWLQFKKDVMTSGRSWVERFGFLPEEAVLVRYTTASMTVTPPSHYPHLCPKCGGPSFNGFT